MPASLAHLAVSMEICPSPGAPGVRIHPLVMTNITDGKITIFDGKITIFDGKITIFDGKILYAN